MRTILILAVILPLAGCLKTDVTEAGIVTPNASGTLPIRSTETVDLSDRLYDADVGGVVMAAGLDDRGHAFAKSGVLRETNTGPQLSGNARYVARYSYRGISGVTKTNTKIYGFTFGRWGNITLDVDLDQKTLTGTSGDLVVNGTLNGATVAGNVTVRGVPGELSGQAGQAGVVAAFAGENKNTVYAGGLVADGVE